MSLVCQIIQKAGSSESSLAETQWRETPPVSHVCKTIQANETLEGTGAR